MCVLERSLWPEGICPGFSNVPEFVAECIRSEQPRRWIRPVALLIVCVNVERPVTQDERVGETVSRNLHAITENTTA